MRRPSVAGIRRDLEAAPFWLGKPSRTLFDGRWRARTAIRTIIGAWNCEGRHARAFGGAETGSASSHGDVVRPYLERFGWRISLGDREDR